MVMGIFCNRHFGLFVKLFVELLFGLFVKLFVELFFGLFYEFFFRLFYEFFFGLFLKAFHIQVYGILGRPTAAGCQLRPEQGGKIVLLVGGGGAFRLVGGLLHGCFQFFRPIHSGRILILFGHGTSSLLSAFSGYSLWCWRAISARITEAAVDTLKELTWPYMGIDTIPSQASFTTRDTPSPSLPMTSAQGPSKLVL